MAGWGIEPWPGLPTAPSRSKTATRKGTAVAKSVVVRTRKRCRSLRTGNARTIIAPTKGAKTMTVRLRSEGI